MSTLPHSVRPRPVTRFARVLACSWRPLALTAAVSLAATTASAATYCSDTVLWKTAAEGNYKWQHWKSGNTAGWTCMTELGGLSYKSEWDITSYGFVDQVGRDGVNALIKNMSTGLTAKQQNTIFSSTRLGGGVNTGFYGWMERPSGTSLKRIEWYIVENWVGNKPGPGGTALATVTISGRRYELFKNDKSGGTYWGSTQENFIQWWSIAVDKTTSSTSNYVQHFRQWQQRGLSGDYILKNVMAYVEPTWPYNSRGRVDVTGIAIQR